MMGISLPVDLNRHLRKEMVTNFAINLVINGAIAWFAFGASQRVPMWGEHGYGADLAITAFFLCWIIGAIFVAMHRSKVRKGKFAPLAITVPAWLPRNALLFGLLLGIFALLTVFPITVGVLWVFGLSNIDLLAFSIFKGAWAGVLACIVIPPSVIFGMATVDAAAPVSAGS